MASAIPFDKKLNSKKLSKPTFNWVGKKPGFNVKRIVKKNILSNNGEGVEVSPWNFVYAFILFVLSFGLLIVSVARLQIIEGADMAERSEKNKVRITRVSAYRGIVFDADGVKLVENNASMNLFITVESYLDRQGRLDEERLRESMDTLGGILGGNWKKMSADQETEYTSLYDRVYSIYSESPYFNKILIATDIDNDTAIRIKARAEKLPGISIDNGNKRRYLFDDYFTHIIGYTGEASLLDIERLEAVLSGEIVGKLGIERYYNKQLKGENGELAEEIDVLGRSVNNEQYIIKPPVSGQNLYLTVQKDVQIKMHDLIEEAVNKHGAVGGAGVIQNVNTGEIVAIVSYPSYDSNQFIGGISHANYSKLLNDEQRPLLNRAIAAQMPPGSTFKTVVAAAGLDAKIINQNTIYVSRAGYTFSNGAPFQEFRRNVYGPLNVTSALSVSSNIFFCEMIRKWDMNKLVPYLENFGIGQYTKIDIPGEAPGRLPSPENKIKLAKTTSPWLEPVWYPEGDSCNSVIGQGITLTTPIQMSNWMAAIANDGTLHRPRVAKKFVDEKGLEYPVEYEPLKENIVSKDTLKIVRKGMWETVNGSRGIVRSLSNTGTTVAAKTGTAEFGRINEKGVYDSTHAWTAGFFPYENPKYSFSVFLEDGGLSSNASAVMREMIIWMVENGYVE
jgi:penicillin-binding protein 2